MRIEARSEVTVINLEVCIGCQQRLCGLLSGNGPGLVHSRIRLERGDRLETRTASCLKIWTVMHGTAAVCASLPDGRRQITSIESPGDTICGSISLPDTHGWLEALESCEICQLDFSHQAEEVHEDPEFLLAMFRATHQRLMAASRSQVTLGRLDSTERVLLFLADMATRGTGGLRRGSTVRLPMSREDIADYLGLNTETVIRVLGRIKKTGLVKFLSPTEFVIPDFPAIERRLPFPLTEEGHDPDDWRARERDGDKERWA